MAVPSAVVRTSRCAATRANELPWGAGADQEPHDQAEIVAGDVDEVALVQVRAATQPRTAHATTIEGEGKAALDQLGPTLEGLLGHA